MQNDPNIWVQFYDHTPPALRWILMISSLGTLTLASWMWHRQHDRITRLEREQNDFARRADIDRLDQRITDVHGDVKKVMFHLIKNDHEY